MGGERVDTGVYTILRGWRVTEMKEVKIKGKSLMCSCNYFNHLNATFKKAEKLFTSTFSLISL